MGGLSAAAGRVANRFRPAAATPVATAPFRKLRREPRCFRARRSSHSLHIPVPPQGASCLGTIVALENTGNTNCPLRAQALAGLFNRQNGGLSADVVTAGDREIGPVHLS